MATNHRELWANPFFEKTLRDIKPSNIVDWREMFLELEREPRITTKERVDLLETKMEKMRKEIKELKEERKKMILINMPNVSDKDAEKQVRNYLEMFRSKATKKVSLLDIMSKLNLPPEQIERVMKRLEREGVKEVE